MARKENDTVQTTVIEVGSAYKGKNILEKLQIARKMFLEKGAKKSGKNMHLEFMYFELEDIVPVAEEVFSEVGLFAMPHILGDTAKMIVYNTDNTLNESPLEFVLPYTPISPIVSNKGKEVTNEMQATGSSITYIRRYLWQVVLDIVEKDEIDARLGQPVPTETTTAPASKKPASAQERKEIKEKLVFEAMASEEMINELKGLLSKLIEKDKKAESFVQEVAMNTNAFTEISAEACAALIEHAKAALACYDKEGVNNEVE